MMGHRQKLNGDGFDAFTRWRHMLAWRPGALAKIKRRHAKRDRKAAKAETRRELAS